MGLNDAAHPGARDFRGAGIGFAAGSSAASHGDRAREAGARIRPRADGDQPTVRYEVHTTNGEMTEISSPNQMPDPVRSNGSKSLHPGHRHHPDRVRGPGDGALPVAARYPCGHGLLPARPGSRSVTTWPLGEIVLDFDVLKSSTRGRLARRMNRSGSAPRPGQRLTCCWLATGSTRSRSSPTRNSPTTRVTGRETPQDDPRQQFDIPVQGCDRGEHPRPRNSQGGPQRDVT